MWRAFEMPEDSFIKLRKIEYAEAERQLESQGTSNARLVSHLSAEKDEGDSSSIPSRVR